MTNMENNNLTEMVMEHKRLEDEFVERFQTLNRRSNLRLVGRRIESLDMEKSELVERVQTFERKLGVIGSEKQTVEKENQRLRNENFILQEKVDKEQAIRRKPEQGQKDIIEGLEKSIHTLRRENRNLASQLDRTRNNQRQKTESDMERIHTLTEENSGLKEEIKQEKLGRKNSYLQLQSVVSSEERSLREAENKAARLKAHLDISEKRNVALNRTIAEVKCDNSKLTTEKTILENQLTHMASQYRERLSEAERRTLLKEQEVHNLKDNLAAEVRIRQNYMQKNARTCEEIRRVRTRLDVLIEEQPNERQLSESSVRMDLLKSTI